MENILPQGTATEHHVLANSIVKSSHAEDTAIFIERKNKRKKKEWKKQWVSRFNSFASTLFVALRSAENRLHGEHVWSNEQY